MKKRRIGRGKHLREQAIATLPQEKRAIEELIKGSLDYLMAMIRSAFYRQFRTDEYYRDSSPWFYIEEIFEGYVIVRSEELPPDEFYYVSFEMGADGTYTFAERPAWEVVELTYRLPAQAIGESARPRTRIEIVEAVTGLTLGETVDTKTGARKITGYGITADVVNANERRYPRAVLQAALDEATLRKGQLGARAVVGEDSHPSDKGQRAQWLETIIRWDAWSIEPDGRTKVEGVIVPTSKGLDAITLLEHEVFPGLSQRAWGYAEVVTENGRQIEEITEIHITGYDTVMEPSDPNGALLTIESARRPRRAPAAPPTRTAQSAAGGPAVEDDEITIEQLKDRYPEQVKQLLSESDQARRDAKFAELRQRYLLDEAADKARAEAKAEGDKRIKELEEAAAKTQAELAQLQEAEQRRAINAHIAEKVGALKGYSEAAKASLIADVQEDKPATTEAADALITRRQKVLDAALSQAALGTMGYAPAGQARPGLQIVGPVIETAGNTPEFARPALLLTEAMRQRGYIAPRPAADAPRSRADVLTEQVLARFDALHQRKLMAEARQIEEAETTADLSLPYSAARVVIAETTPLLVAAMIFDVATTDVNPSLVFYETFSYETGGQPTVTDEDVTADLNGWVALANKRVNVGSVVVTNSGATVTYVEGTDYVIDYGEGKLMALATITDNQALKVDYTYQAMRKGEMQPIERGKVSLAHVTLTAAADRLATQISREAIVFSRSQLGWDAVTRTINALIERIRRKIDTDLMMTALQQVLQVPSNSGGTWTASSDTLAALVAKIGVAKQKVAARNFEPTFILMSGTNADRLTNPENNFHIFGAAGITMGADGRLQVKGLPIYSSNNFRDDFILLGNRELVQHRIYQPMTIMGPYPTYSSDGELIAAEQYYVEEFNGNVTPIKTKGAYVKVA